MTSPEPPPAVRDAAALLLDAWRTGTRLDLLTQRWPGLTLDDAEAIAARTVELFCDPVVGFKLGFTSGAMREQMNIAAPNYGRLTAIMDVARGDGGRRLAHPRIEPEVALVMGEAVGGEGVTLAAVARAVASVHPALEIVDTRYRDYRFTLVDNTADNSSAAAFVLGPAHRPGDLLHRPLAVALETDGATVAHGSSTDAMGGPLEATLWLAQMLARRGLTIAQGAIILTGGLTQAPYLVPGREVSARFEALGTVSYLWSGPSPQI